MCGIAGIYAYHYAARPVDRKELDSITSHMTSRGPDGAGTWYSQDGRAAFGHRRLSIIDLSEAGAQPMASADGRLHVTFNGEIYNYRALRRELEARGAMFQSQSDTEVLLHLYADRGEAMVHDLRGMFAFAIWDADRRRLFLARDPYGIKPLYYSDDGWTVRFASQVKALLAGGAISREPDPAGQVGFCLWGSVPEPFTTYSQIRALPAGCTAVVDRLGLHGPARYHSIAATYCEIEAHDTGASRAEDRRAQVRAALMDSVRHHLVADVPVGAFLSAGIDSGALVGLMRDAGKSDIQTVTIGFEEFRGRPDDETPLAAEVARTYGTQHTTRIVTESEFKADLPRILAAMDQPSTDGLNTWFVSKAARELGLKVAISGLGGDELFGGYPSFLDLPRWVGRLRLAARLPGLGLATRAFLDASGLGSLMRSPKAAGMLEYGGTYAGAYLLRRGLFMPWELDQVLERDTVRQGLSRLGALGQVKDALSPTPRSPFARVAALESSLYMRNQLLRDSDWASMAQGLEIRLPLVDHKLLEGTAPHQLRDGPGGQKRLLAAAPQVALPRSVTTRPKTGFLTPIATWLMTLQKTDFKGIPLLASANCGWSRRWAYGIGLAAPASTAVPST